METIYVNKQTIKSPKETVYKRKLIIHDDKSILVFCSRRVFRVPSVQGDENLLELTKEVTGLELTEEDIFPIVRVISNYNRYDCRNNKLIPINKEVVRDYYSYYYPLTNEILEGINQHGNDWYQKAIRLSKYRVLTEKDSDLNKLRIPVKYLWKRER